MNIVHRVMPGLILGTILSLASFSATASAAPVTITSISGWTAGNIVVSGEYLFTGNPEEAFDRGLP
jgi:hypothetical protein